MDDKPTLFYIARHGETEFNAAGIMQGMSVDSPLTENGVRQAQELGAKLKEIHFDHVFSSDLRRAHRTAELATIERNLAINTSHLLRERSYGKYDGKDAELYRKENAALFEKKNQLEYQEQRNFRFAPDMETDDEAARRLVLFLRETAVTYPGKTILAVCHGGIIRQFLIHIGWGTPDELKGGVIKNAAYLKVETDGINIRVLETSGVEKATQ